MSFYAGHGYRIDRINLRSEKEILKRIAKLQQELDRMIQHDANAAEIAIKKAIIDGLKWVITNQNNK